MSIDTCFMCSARIDTDYSPEVYREEFDDKCLCDNCFDEVMDGDIPAAVYAELTGEALLTTLCWNCSKEYPVEAGKCQHCEAANANFDLAKAILEAQA